MWVHMFFLALALTSVVLCLDSNEIRSSREIITESQQTAKPAQRETVAVNVHNFVGRRQQAECPQRHGSRCRGKRCKDSKECPPAQPEVVKRNECSKSRDCEEGYCCVTYPSGRRCQRLLQKGDICLLGRKTRHWQRCGCGSGLQCHRQEGKRSGQGVCDA